MLKRIFITASLATALAIGILPTSTGVQFTSLHASPPGDIHPSVANRVLKVYADICNENYGNCRQLYNSGSISIEIEYNAYGALLGYRVVNGGGGNGILILIEDL